MKPIEGIGFPSRIFTDSKVVPAADFTDTQKTLGIEFINPQADSGADTFVVEACGQDMEAPLHARIAQSFTNQSNVA